MKNKEILLLGFSESGKTSYITLLYWYLNWGKRDNEWVVVPHDKATENYLNDNLKAICHPDIAKRCFPPGTTRKDFPDISLNISLIKEDQPEESSESVVKQDILLKIPEYPGELLQELTSGSIDSFKEIKTIEKKLKTDKNKREPLDILKHRIRTADGVVFLIDILSVLPGRKAEAQRSFHTLMKYFYYLHFTSFRKFRKLQKGDLPVLNSKKYIAVFFSKIDKLLPKQDSANPYNQLVQKEAKKLREAIGNEYFTENDFNASKCFKEKFAPTYTFLKNTFLENFEQQFDVFYGSSCEDLYVKQGRVTYTIPKLNKQLEPEPNKLEEPIKWFIEQL